MARQRLALFLLFVLGLVLPAAGAPRLYCVRSSAALPSAEVCGESCVKKSCCAEHESPGDPSCFAVAKPLPEGVQQATVVIPALVGVLMPPVELPVPPVISLAVVDHGPISCRAPPDPLPLYLAHRSLLL